MERLRNLEILEALNNDVFNSKNYFEMPDNCLFENSPLKTPHTPGEDLLQEIS